MVLSMMVPVARAQSDTGADEGTNFRGLIRYENNQPAQFVQVELWTDGESSWRTITNTDRMGKFHAGAPCMVIQYKIDLKGYRPVWGRVDMSIPPCRVLEWITLKPNPKSMEGGPASGVIDGRIAGIPAEAKGEFDVGQKAINDDHFAEAVPHLTKAVELYPKYAEAYQLLGLAQLQTHDSVKAEASLRRALEIEDRMPQAQYLLGMLYAMSGRTELAEKPLTRFAELAPDNPDAQFELARVDFALKKFSDAELHARNAIKLKETKPAVYIVLGYALLRQKRGDDAKRAFEKYLKLAPASSEAADMRKLISQIDEQARN
jgi:Flp pilus assembly protein TadD